MAIIIQISTTFIIINTKFFFLLSLILNDFSEKKKTQLEYKTEVNNYGQIWNDMNTLQKRQA
jgi:hypothetical protein